MAEAADAVVTSLFQAAAGQDPAYHALIIGVSRYRHLPGGGGPVSTHPLAAGLTQLSAAAASALRVAMWIRDHYEPPNAGRGSIRLLLSPAPGEELAENVSVPPTTSREVRSAIAAWRRDVRAHPGNVAMLYGAGHGIQKTMEGGILLLEDFADPGALTPLEGSLDIQSVRRGIVSDPNEPDTCTPRLQFYFYDACRVRLPAAVNYDSLTAGITLDEPQGDSAKASWVCFGARPQEYAFADPRRRATLYSQALLDCLETRAPTHNDGRTIRFAELHTAIEESVEELSRRFNEEQQATFGGIGEMRVPVHLRPEVILMGPDEEGVETRPVRFHVEPSLPVFARASGVVMGETEQSDQPIQMPVGGEYEAVVPLPWGGEYTERFDVLPGADELSVSIDVPPSLLTTPPEPGPESQSELPVADIPCVVRFLRWTVDRFDLADSAPRVIEYALLDTGDVSLRLSIAHRGTTYPIGENAFVLDVRDTPALVQIDSAAGRSPIIALPLGGGNAATCEVIIRYRDSGVAATARPGLPRSAAVAGYLQTGRADRALAAMSVDAAELLRAKMANPISAACGGYALLKLNDLQRVGNWSDNLANWFPALPDGAVIAGAVAARRGQPDTARRWFGTAAERGIPIFSEGLSLLVAESHALGATAAIADLTLSADFTALCTTLQPPQQLLPDGGWLQVVPRPDGLTPEVRTLD